MKLSVPWKSGTLTHALDREVQLMFTVVIHLRAFRFLRQDKCCGPLITVSKEDAVSTYFHGRLDWDSDP